MASETHPHASHSWRPWSDQDETTVAVQPTSHPHVYHLAITPPGGHWTEMAQERGLILCSVPLPPPPPTSTMAAGCLTSCIQRPTGLARGMSPSSTLRCRIVPEDSAGPLLDTPLSRTVLDGACRVLALPGLPVVKLSSRVNPARQALAFGDGNVIRVEGISP